MSSRVQSRTIFDHAPRRNLYIPDHRKWRNTTKSDADCEESEWCCRDLRPDNFKIMYRATRGNKCLFKTKHVLVTRLHVISHQEEIPDRTLEKKNSCTSERSAACIIKFVGRLFNKVSVGDCRVMRRAPIVDCPF